MSQQWYVKENDSITSPISSRQLLELARSGVVLPEQLVSLDNRIWTKARKVKGLVFSHPTPISDQTDINLHDTPVPSQANEITAIFQKHEMNRRPVFSNPEIEQEYDFILAHPRSVIPGYIIDKLIGQGSMGLVFKAQQLKLHRDVAIKVVAVTSINRALARSRFHQESKIIAQFQHPNIVAAFDFGEFRDRLYLVMELLDGMGLDDWIDKQGPMNETTAWQLVRQAVSGLAYAAKRKCIHRDVKPANILLLDAPAGMNMPSGIPLVKLTDFGLAQMHATDLPSERLTATGIVLGTPMYMAPEQFGNEELDQRADIYSLGATLAFAVGGRSPFSGSSIWELMTNKMKDNSELLSRLSSKLSPESLELLKHMLEPKRQNRISNYEQVMERIDLLPCMQQNVRQMTSQSSISVAKPEGAFPPFLRQRRWHLVGMLILFVGLGCITWLVNSSLTPAQPNSSHYQVTGYNEPLFDGTSLSNWKIVSGVWSATQDAESTRILSGQGNNGKPGILRRVLPPLKNYRVSMGVDLRQAEAVEVHFALANDEEKQPRRLMIRVTHEGAILAERFGNEGPWKAKSSLMALPKQSGTEDVNYWELRIDYLAGWWGASFHGTTLGSLVQSKNTDISEIRIVVHGQAVAFADMQVMELIAKDHR